MYAQGKIGPCATNVSKAVCRALKGIGGGLPATADPDRASYARQCLAAKSLCDRMGKTMAAKECK